MLDVHDLHVWTLTSDMDAGSAHFVSSVRADGHRVLDHARACFADGYGVTHGTFHIEPQRHDCGDEIIW